MGITSALTGLSIPVVKLLYGAVVAHGVAGLVWPGAPTLNPENIEDFGRRAWPLGMGGFPWDGRVFGGDGRETRRGEG
jgi:hypothetical protein